MRTIRSGASGDRLSQDVARVLDTLIEAGPFEALPVSGSIMSPTLLDGDSVIVMPFLGLPRAGQIVLARIAGRPAFRRLLGVSMVDGRRLYHLQGDVRPAALSRVHREDLFGRAIEVVREGRRRPIDEGARNPGASSADAALSPLARGAAVPGAAGGDRAGGR